VTRPRDFISVLDDPSHEPLKLGDPAGELLVQLVVHIFFSDEVLHDRELELFARLVGGKVDDELRARIRDIGNRGMDFDKLAAAFPNHDDRQDIITLAEHAWWADNMLEPGELDVADKLAEVLEIRER
jgi:uncharacterized tellurite resistance protein B-like protein